MADTDEDELIVALSPVQLAAVLEDQTIERPETLANQIWGAVTVVGGAIELVGSAALLLTPEPTMATKAGGIVLGLHGLDTVSTGLRQLFVGRPQTTMTAQAIAAAVRNVGFSPRNARNAGTVVDVAIPLVSGLPGLLRVWTIRRGVMILEESEITQGIRDTGHTIRKHVGKTEAELRARLAQQTRITGASSFRSIEGAGLAVSRGLRANAKSIQLWSRTAPVGDRLPILFDAGEVIGDGIPRSTGAFVPMTKVRIIVEKVADVRKVYFVLTAYPVP